MADPIADLARKLRSIEEQLRKLGTAARAPLTSVEGGRMTFTKEDVESVSIGLNDDGDSFIRVMNDDGSAPAFEVVSGVVVFPQGVSAWQQNGALTVNAQGNPTYTGGAYTPLFAATVPLTTDEIFLGGFAASVSAGTAAFQVRCVPVNTRDGYSGGTPEVYENATFTSSGNPFPNTLTIPTSIWSPSASPVGTLANVIVDGRIVSGGGTLDLYSVYGVRCV